jgi:hypothetical protein
MSSVRSSCTADARDSSLCLEAEIDP